MRRAGLGLRGTNGAKGVYRTLAHGIVELLAAAGLPADERPTTVSLEPALVGAIDAAPGPIVLFASHTNNWELAAGAVAGVLATRRKRLFIVAKRQSVGGIDAFITRLRASFGVGVIPPTGALARCRVALERGDLVVLPIDQVPDRSAHALSVPFLGEHALVDRAPATLAWRARATVLVLATERLDTGEQQVRLLGTLSPDRATSSRRWIAETTTAATRLLDTFVRAHPASWLWTHRRWRAPRREILSRPASHVTSTR